VDISAIENFSAREYERFQRVCNSLLANTFVVNFTIKDEQKVPNPDYIFLAKNKELIQNYLDMAGWSLHKSEHHDYYYVSNDMEANRLRLNKETTGIILALRLIYDENSETAGLNQDVELKMRELLEKVVTDYPVLSNRGNPNMKEVARYLRIIEGHMIIQRISGNFSDMDCRFLILPTILTVVSAEKIRILAAQLKEEESGSPDDGEINGGNVYSGETYGTEEQDVIEDDEQDTTDNDE
jgi:hypothetical protein